VQGNLLDKTYTGDALSQKLVTKINDENYNPNLVDATRGLKQESFYGDISPYALIGDPRWSLGAAMQSMLQFVLPRNNAYQAFLELGATQVINNEPCDAEGMPIANIPQNITEAFVQGPVDIEEMQTHFDNTKNDALKTHLNAFVAYIRKVYLSRNYKIDAVFITTPRFFFVKLYTGENTAPQNLEFLRYYHDQAQNVADELQIPLQTVQGLSISQESFQQNYSSMYSLMRDIPDYTKMI
jgi:hypothetical protein